MRISDWSSDVCSSDLRSICSGQTRVERIAQTVAEQIDRQHRYRQQNSRVQDDLEINGNEIAALGDHVSPTGRLRRDAHAEKRQGRFDQHGRGRHESRSEEHTSELKSLMRNSYAVFCLKKKT